jgi:hypothetical protein
MELRQNVGEILERLHYLGKQYQITRKTKPMARVVNEALMRALDELLHTDQATADTLALMVDEEATTLIEESDQEWATGERIPLEEALR